VFNTCLEGFKTQCPSHADQLNRNKFLSGKRLNRTSLGR
jgi:hypothetical protein